MDQSEKSDILTTLLRVVVQNIGRTWKFPIQGNTDFLPAKTNRMIFCSWHENIVSLCYFLKGNPLYALTSQHHDGRRIALILQHWNMSIIYGSFERNGMSAIRQSVRQLQQGNNLLITPDGPRGPRLQAKKGIAQISILAQAPIVPLCFIPKQQCRLRSWDRFIIPLPFTTIDVFIGQPIIPPNSSSTTDEAIETVTQAVQQSLTAHVAKE